MFSALIAAAVVSSSQIDAPALVSKMLARYDAAKTVTGTIEMRQSFAGEAVHVNMTLDIQRPTLLSVVETVRETGTVRRIVADGARIQYNLPSTTADLARNDLLATEPQIGPGGQFEVIDVLAMGRPALRDRQNEPLRVAVSRPQDLQDLISEWVTVEYYGDDEIDGTPVRLVGGVWREYGIAAPTGEYRMSITDEGELLRFTRVETLGTAEGEVAQINTQYRVRLELDVPIEPEAFTIRTR